MALETPFIPSPYSVIKTALDIARVGKHDIFYDLGAGDGRVVIEAAQRGAYSIAVELDPFLAEVIRQKAKELKLEDRIRVIEASYYDVYLGYATVIYTYLYQSINEKLSEKYERELKIGTRIVTIDFPIPNWVPVKIKRLLDDSGIVRTIFLYIIGVSNPSALMRRIQVLDYKSILRNLGWSY